MNKRCKTCEHREKFRGRNVCKLRTMKIDKDGKTMNINFTIKDVDNLYCDNYQLANIFILNA